MPPIDISVADFDAVLPTLPAEGPLVMVNLLRFHTTAQYEPGTAHTPCSGIDAYLTRYVPTLSEIIQPLGGSELVYGGTVAARLIGPTDVTWDAIGIMRYPSAHTFQRLLESPDYQHNAAPHRKAALAQWQLFVTTALN